MKKIIVAILLFILIAFAIHKEISENVINQSENIAIQEEGQNVVSNTVIINEVQENTLENKTIAFIGDSLIEGYGNEFHGFDYYLAKDLPNTNFINHSKLNPHHFDRI